MPLAALGQTVLWDEPMKAVLLDGLAEHAPDTRLRLSVMDTDYFAKPPLETEGRGEYALLPHNDTVTKDLWVATGEISRLFGCETVPSREMYHRHGVQLEVVAGAASEPRGRFLDRATEAWGWLGLVHTGSRRTLAGEIPLSGVLPTLLEQLRWGFGETADALADPDARQVAHDVADRWLRWVEAYAGDHPDASLTDLYQAFLPCLVSALREGAAGITPPGAPAPSIPFLEVGGSMEGFRFNRETAGSPRFALLDLFLRPDTRDAAREAYDDAVRGSDIYTLDRFAMGAVPFDLVVPGRGRGTLRIIPERVIIETEERIYLRPARPVENVCDLAEVVEAGLGRGVSLVGKALTLIAMLARSALVVLNETGSTYVWRTRKMMERLCRRGIAFDLYPIVRLQYPTWETFAVTDRTLRLPGHLARAFGAEALPARDLAGRWHDVYQAQRDLLQEAAAAVGPRQTLDFLARREGAAWAERRRELDDCQAMLLSLRDRLFTIKHRIQDLLREVRHLKASLDALSRMKGDDFRQHVKPLRDRLWELGVRSLPSGAGAPALSSSAPALSSPAPALSSPARAAHGSPPLAAQSARSAPVLVRPSSGSASMPLDHEIGDLLARLKGEIERRRWFDDQAERLTQTLHEREQQIRALDRERQALLQESRVQDARRRRAGIQVEAQAAKLEIVRSAFLSAEGLEHNEHRPAAWWLPLLSPDGRWFREIQRHTQAYLEPLSCRSPGSFPAQAP